jgi:hypothetical protein
MPRVVGTAVAETDPSADAVASAAAAAAGAAEVLDDAGDVLDVEVVGFCAIVVPVVAVEGVNVVAAEVCAEAVESVGVVVVDAAWRVLVAVAGELPVAERDCAAGAPAAWMTNKVSPTAAVVTVLRRAEVREIGISRIPPMTVLHEGRYRWVVV